jgi:hypothetical protein
MMLTTSEVRDLFDYDPITGQLSRKLATKGYLAGRSITRKTDKGYLVTTVNGRSYKVHHLVWVWHGNESTTEIDHKNRNRSDNRIDNLRPCTRIQNLINSGPKRGGYKGVSLCGQTGRWVAQIGVGYKNIKIGRFDTPEQAALAYNEAALTHFGEFAFLNEVSL